MGFPLFPCQVQTFCTRVKVMDSLGLWDSIMEEFRSERSPQHHLNLIEPFVFHSGSLFYLVLSCNLICVYFSGNLNHLLFAFSLFLVHPLIWFFT